LALPGERVGADIAKRRLHGIGLTRAPTRVATAGPTLGFLIAPAWLGQVKAWLRSRWTWALAAGALASATAPTVNASGLVAPWRGLKFIGPDRLAITVCIDRVRQIERLRCGRQGLDRLLDRLGCALGKIPRLGWLEPATSRWPLG
jgi:hypothetical protein